MLFGIDDYYLRNQGLFDEDNQTNYGDYFPRDKLADFIKKIDVMAKGLPKESQPKALFVDYDFSFTSTAYNRGLTKEDKAFLDVLKEDRAYTILIPKTRKYNYIESTQDKKIQELIKQKKIIFVSVGLAKAEDFTTKRYIAYSRYKHSIEQKEEIYPHVSVVMWLLSNGKSISQENIAKFKEQSVVANRIIIKSYKKSPFKEREYLHRQSNWENLSYYSANYPLDMIVTESFAGALIMLGANYTTSTDIFTVNSKQQSTQNGVEVHAHALMTLFNFDGALKQYNAYMSVFLVFITFFIVSVLIQILLHRFKVTSVEFDIIISLIVITLFMIPLSLYILLSSKAWFNWFIPVLLFEIVEIIEFINRYLLNLFNKEKKL
jgi:CHASE2 domain-containing sensor protein